MKLKHKFKIGLAVCVLLAGAYFAKPIVAGIGDVIAYFNEAGTEVFSIDQDGKCTVTSFETSTVDINGGAIDGTAIGASSASTGAFTTLTASGVTSITDDTDASDTSTASLKTAGGLAVLKKAYFGGDVNIISGDITGITDLLVADGGTGLSALTAHKLIAGNGTSAATLIDVGTNGQILVGQTGADPSWQTMDTDATIDETGTITIASDVVSYDKMQDTSGTDVILGRSTASGGTVEEIACTAAGRALLDDAAASNQRTTLGVDVAGTDNSTDVTLHSSATTGGLSISTQEISHRAATNAQTGYMTAALVANIEQDEVEELTPVNAVASEGLITMGGVATGDETFVIDSQTFTWKASRSGAGEVTIGDNADSAVTNIVTAVTADLATVTAAYTSSSTATITAATKGVAGDSIVFTENSSNMTINGAGTLGTTTAGVDGTVGVANELAADASYLYHCVDTNTIADDNWRRISLGSAY